MKRMIIGISGASGVALGIGILKILKDAEDWETHLVMTPSAVLTLQEETSLSVAEVEKLADIVYAHDNLGAGISSGSFVTEGMIIAPGSMKTVAGIACGYSENLLLRAADVTLKERRKLVILPREAPLSVIHLRNLLTLSEAGAVIFPPVPSFYNRPGSIDEIVEHISMRALSYFGFTDVPAWAGLHRTE